MLPLGAAASLPLAIMMPQAVATFVATDNAVTTKLRHASENRSLPQAATGAFLFSSPSPYQGWYPPTFAESPQHTALPKTPAAAPAMAAEATDKTEAPVRAPAMAAAAAAAVAAFRERVLLEEILRLRTEVAAARRMHGARP